MQSVRKAWLRVKRHGGLFTAQKRKTSKLQFLIRAVYHQNISVAKPIRFFDPNYQTMDPQYFLNMP